MSQFAYNVITGQLDLVGSGGGGPSYIDGVVDDSSLLPVTLGTPALDSVYLAKAGSGVWLINRRPAGLYCRIANNGDLDDWQYLGAFPEVNADANWALYNSADPTKEMKFDVSGITAGTTRTLTVPDKDIVIAGANDVFTYAVVAVSSNHNPAGTGQTYYIGTAFDLAPVTNATLREITFPFNAVITDASVIIHVGGSLGTAASSGTVQLHNKNTSTSVPLVNAGIGFSAAAQSTNAGGLAVNIDGNTPYAIRIDTPVFTANPTAVRYAVVLYIQKQ